VSPDPGERDHETRGWNHAMCDFCWYASPIGQEREPVRVRASDEEGNIHPTEFAAAICCFCGEPTRGIWVRQDATTVHKLFGIPSVALPYIQAWADNFGAVVEINGRKSNGERIQFGVVYPTEGA